jgi:hypothetical protein
VKISLKATTEITLVMNNEEANCLKHLITNSYATMDMDYNKIRSTFLALFESVDTKED